MNEIKRFLIKGITSLMLVLMATFLVNDVANAQQNSVKTNLANLIISGGSLHYERVISDNGSVQLGAFISSLEISGTNFSGFGIIPQYRYYPGGSEIPHGFFLAPLISFQTFGLETTVSSLGSSSTASADYTLFGAGLDVGYQWLIGRSFAIELSTGATFNSTNLEVTSSAGSQSSFDTGQIGSFAPRLGVSFGYAF